MYVGHPRRFLASLKSKLLTRFREQRQSIAGLLPARRQSALCTVQLSMEQSVG